MEPDHDTSAELRSTGVSKRPNLNQWRTGRSPLAIATKLARRASEANRS